MPQQIAALENQVRLDVQSAWDSLALSARTIQAAELNVAQARRALEMTEATYRLGAATPLGGRLVLDETLAAAALKPMAAELGMTPGAVYVAKSRVLARLRGEVRRLQAKDENW